MRWVEILVAAIWTFEMTHSALAVSMVAQDTQWRDDEDRFEGLAVIRSAYSVLGLREQAAAIAEVLETMKATGIGRGDHDHDGDGEQDH